MTLLGNMVQAIEVVVDAQSPLGVALFIARVLSYLSSAVFILLVTQRMRQKSSDTSRSATSMRTTIALLVVSVLLVLVLKASYDAGRSWSDLFDSAVLANAVTSPLGVVVGVQLLVFFVWQWLTSMKTTKPRWQMGMLISTLILVTTFVVDGVGLTSQTEKYSKFSVTLVESDVVGDFTVAPTQVGAAEVHLYFSPPSGMLSQLQNVKLEFKGVDNAKPVVVPVVELGPNHWLGIAEFITSGRYTMTVQAVTATNIALQYTTKILINP